MRLDIKCSSPLQAGVFYYALYTRIRKAGLSCKSSELVCASTLYISLPTADAVTAIIGETWSLGNLKEYLALT